MSILFLTVHKAASSFMSSEVLGPLSVDLGLRRLNPFGQAARAGIHKDEVVIDSYAGEAALLGPIRIPGCIQDPRLFDSWRTVLLLRDPRDVICSLHFHLIDHRPADGPLKARALANQAEARRFTIDENAMRFLPVIRERFEDYRTRFADRPNTLLLRYEDMIADWPAFCRSLGRFCGASDAWIAGLTARQTEVQPPAAEQATSHKRQVRAGEHARKMSPETMRQLNAELSDILSWLGHA